MKKSIYLALLLAACRPSNHDGAYVSHIEGRFSIVDDTIKIADTVVINKTGYQPIREGKMLPKVYKSRSWTLRSPDAPVMQIEGDRILIGSTIYQKMP
jgi:hypothetical protein